jgi:hypothetical protein
MPSELVVDAYWRAPGDIIAMTHGGQIPMEMIPPGIQSLAGTAIDKQLVLVARARDKAGQVIGIITEIEIFSESDAFEVYLTLVIPSRGALASYQTKSRKTMMAPFLKVIETGKAWSGEMAVVQTAGPESANRGTVIAATGEFAGMAGFHQQTITYHSITSTGSVGLTCERFSLGEHSAVPHFDQ